MKNRIRLSLAALTLICMGSCSNEAFEGGTTDNE